MLFWYSDVFIFVLRIEELKVMQTMNNNKSSLSALTGELQSALKFSLLTGQRPQLRYDMPTVDSVRKKRLHNVTVYDPYFIGVSSP